MWSMNYFLPWRIHLLPSPLCPGATLTDGTGTATPQAGLPRGWDCSYL